MHILLLAFIALFASISPCKAESRRFSGDKIHILILHSYHQGMLWVDSVTRGLNDELPFSTGQIVHVEHLDAKRHSSPEHQKAVADFYRIKFSKIKFSGIIASDDIAFNFALKYRSELFNNAPVVFCGVNFFQKELYRSESNFTGVVERNDFLKTINLAFSLHPQAKSVFVINDTTRTGQANQKAIEALRPFFPKGKEIVFSGNLSMAELKKKIAALPEDYVILLLSYNLDSFGQYFTYRELGKNIGEVAKVPVYCVWDFFFEDCATGGCITRGFDQGKAAARLLKRVLAGEKASSIPVQSRYITKYMFDYKKLKQFSIPESRLPQDSIILNQPYSFYRENKALFWQIVSVFLLFALLSTGLAISLMKLLKSQKEVEESRQSLKITLDSIAEGVIATDSEGKITRMNPVAEKISGWNLEEARGKVLSQFFQIKNGTSGEICANLEQQILDSQDLVNLSRFNLLIPRSGKELPISSTAAPIRDEFGVITGIVVVFRDMTEESIVQEKLRQSQKMDAVGQLAGGVAHDFNNALTGIIGAVQLLEKEFSSDHSKRILKLIEKSADRAADLTAKLLAFSRKTNIDTAPQDLHAIVGAATDILSRTIDRRITISKNLEANKFNVKGNFSELESVLLNLGINASHAMPDGGELSFSSKNVELGVDYCHATNFSISPGEYVVLEVKDTGTGIEPDNLGRIFEPFFTTKDQGKGTGLGLSAAYGTIVQHHGAINAYSEPGRGTIFRIYLPTVNLEAAQEKKSNNLVMGSGTILLIDDEPAIRFTNRLLLENAGYKVIVAENGISGIEKFRKNADEIDLVILDMIMPEMNGCECFDHLQKIDAKVKVILCSGFPQDADVAKMKKLGLVSFLYKPCRGEELTRQVAEALAKDQEPKAKQAVSQKD